MSKEEPAWRAEMEELIHSFLSDITMYGEVAETSGRIAEIFTARIAPHIRAAEQRGFQAGVNKTGDSVGKLREQLKTAREDARREAARAIRASKDEARGAVQATKVVDFCADLIDPDKP